jgi:hypothetical protein
MKKLPMAIGAAVGFLAGSRAGRGPYTKVEQKTRELSHHPRVRKVIDTADQAIHERINAEHSVASEKIAHLKSVVHDKVPFGSHGTAACRSDPQDHAFGLAALHDQNIVDELEGDGVSEEDLPDRPMRHPRAGGKADPAGFENESLG